MEWHKVIHTTPAAVGLATAVCMATGMMVGIGMAISEVLGFRHALPWYLAMPVVAYMGIRGINWSHRKAKIPRQASSTLASVTDGRRPREHATDPPASVTPQAEVGPSKEAADQYPDVQVMEYTTSSGGDNGDHSTKPEKQELPSVSVRCVETCASTEARQEEGFSRTRDRRNRTRRRLHRDQPAAVAAKAPLPNPHQTALRGYGEDAESRLARDDAGVAAALTHTPAPGAGAGSWGPTHPGARE